MNTKAAGLFNDPHTTYAAALYAGCELLTYWFPDFSLQLGQTQDWILVYGMLLTGIQTKYKQEKNESTPPTPPPSGGMP